MAALSFKKEVLTYLFLLCRLENSARIGRVDIGLRVIGNL